MELIKNEIFDVIDLIPYEQLIKEKKSAQNPAYVSDDTEMQFGNDKQVTRSTIQLHSNSKPFQEKYQISLNGWYLYIEYDLTDKKEYVVLSKNKPQGRSSEYSVQLRNKSKTQPYSHIADIRREYKITNFLKDGKYYILHLRHKHQDCFYFDIIETDESFSKELNSSNYNNFDSYFTLYAGSFITPVHIYDENKDAKKAERNKWRTESKNLVIKTFGYEYYAKYHLSGFVLDHILSLKEGQEILSKNTTKLTKKMLVGLGNLQWLPASENSSKNSFSWQTTEELIENHQLGINNLNLRYTLEE